MNSRLKILLSATVLVIGLQCASAQSICFWTDDREAVPIRIYIDQSYIGDITLAMTGTPAMDQYGCLSVDTSPGKHFLTAVDRYGRIYEGWPGWVRPRLRTANFIKLEAGKFFNVVDRSGYGYVYDGWSPIVSMPLIVPAPPHPREPNPKEDPAITAAMAIGALGVTGLMTAAVVENWNYPDARYPYISAGFNTEYMFGLREWRNTVQLRARFGNLGGFSLTADAGRATQFDSLNHGIDRITWSVGAGLDYSSFCFSVRYKAPTGDYSSTFLIANLGFDWWIGEHFGINLHTGFGVSGFGGEGLFDYFEYPLGMGLLVKF